MAGPHSTICAYLTAREFHSTRLRVCLDYTRVFAAGARPMPRLHSRSTPHRTETMHLKIQPVDPAAALAPNRGHLHRHGTATVTVTHNLQRGPSRTISTSQCETCPNKVHEY